MLCFISVIFDLKMNTRNIENYISDLAWFASKNLDIEMLKPCQTGNVILKTKAPSNGKSNNFDTPSTNGNNCAKI